jgi:hypothetical protein
MATEYGKLNWHQRGQIKNSNPQRYLKIKTEHEQAEAAIRAQMADAKTYANKANHRLVLLEFLVDDKTSGVTPEDVAKQRATASHALAVEDAIKQEEAEEGHSRRNFRR